MGEQEAAGLKFQRKVPREGPVGTLKGDVAQLGEHLPCKQGVKGSNPSISMIAVKRGNPRAATGCHGPWRRCTLKTEYRTETERKERIRVCKDTERKTAVERVCEGRPPHAERAEEKE